MFNPKCPIPTSGVGTCFWFVVVHTTHVILDIIGLCMGWDHTMILCYCSYHHYYHSTVHYMCFPSVNQKLLENPRSEWRFLARKIPDFYGPWLPVPAMFDDTGSPAQHSPALWPALARLHQPVVQLGLVSPGWMMIDVQECARWCPMGSPCSWSFVAPVLKTQLINWI